MVSSAVAFGSGAVVFGGQVQERAELAGLIFLQAEGAVNFFPEELLGRVGGDLLDIHAALGAGHHDRPVGFAVDGNAEVELFFDLDAFFHQHADPQYDVWNGGRSKASRLVK